MTYIFAEFSHELDASISQEFLAFDPETRAVILQHRVRDEFGVERESSVLCSNIPTAADEGALAVPSIIAYCNTVHPDHRNRAFAAAILYFLDETNQ
jgi:hypothetical protein